MSNILISEPIAQVTSEHDPNISCITHIISIISSLLNPNNNLMSSSLFLCGYRRQIVYGQLCNNSHSFSVMLDEPLSLLWHRPQRQCGAGGRSSAVCCKAPKCCLYILSGICFKWYFRGRNDI